MTKINAPASRPDFKNVLNTLRLFAACFASVAVPASQASSISGIWANEGGDKVTQDELRASNHKENLTGTVINRAWNGKSLSLFGAHNEVVSFNLVIEAANTKASNVTVSFDTLTGPGGASIHSVAASGNQVFDWVGRDIELFYVRYLQIRGLSFFGYNKWDERQIPRRFQRPWTGNGVGTGLWTDRPDHDKYYPDALVPLELVKQFDIQAGQNQSIWSDIYIPKGVPSGSYRGVISIRENGVASRAVPVTLTVENFTLPDAPTTKTMGHLDTTEIMWHYVTNWGGYVNFNTTGGARIKNITDKYYELFHRHKMSLIGEDECLAADQPCESSRARLDGSLFTAANGYDGPGVAASNGIFSIGTYGTWSWKNGVTQASMWQHADNWVNWFNTQMPGVDYFLYLEDEPPPADYAQVNQWATWLKQDPGPGKNLLSFSTHSDVLARNDMPAVSIPATADGIGSCDRTGLCDMTSVNQNAADYYSQPGHRLWFYNDCRPATGSTDTEDDGVALRQLPWAQYKKNIDRWFYWYVNMDFQGDPLTTAVTWGSVQYKDPVMGEYGNNGTTNGTGLLVYPGTDLYHPEDSYNVDGPLASLRLKEWRRGIQDTDYLALAQKINPGAAASILQTVVPNVLWEYPATDPGYFVGDISWSVNPDNWESARAQLSSVIAGYCSSNKASFCN